MEHVHHVGEVGLALAEEPEEKRGFRMLVSLLIALAAVSTAFLVWASGVASNSGGEEDRAAIAAGVKAQDADAGAKTQSLQDAAAFLAYKANNELGDLLSDYINSPAGLADPKSPALQDQRDAAWSAGLATASDFFEPRWVSLQPLPRGGLIERYDAPGEYAGVKADAAQDDDVDPALHLHKADSFIAKSASLIGVLPFMGVSIWLLTLAYDSRRGVRAPLAGLGSLVLVIGASYGVYLNFIR